jgi:hypothetical protein
VARGRRRVSRSSRCLRFDGQRTPDFRARQKQIFRYVVWRQQQDLQGE